MSGSSGWLIPAISASASLFGTIVGGFTTYWTSKKSFERQLAYDQSAQRNTQLRKAATRFITAITDTPIVQSGLARISEEWGPVVSDMAVAQSDGDFVALARLIVAEIPPNSSREEALVELMRSTAAFDDDIGRGVNLLTELRLIAPRDVAESAQRVLYTAATRELTAAISPQRQRQATTTFNREINDFFNRVRHHMSVEDIDFDFFNEGVAQRILKI